MQSENKKIKVSNKTVYVVVVDLTKNLHCGTTGIVDTAAEISLPK